MGPNFRTLELLIQLKRAAGRPENLEVIAELQGTAGRTAREGGIVLTRAAG